MSPTALAWGVLIAFVLGFVAWVAVACVGALAARLGEAMLKAWKKAWKEHRL